LGFATVDFERYSVGFDKARYKAGRLREELCDIAITLSVVKYRLTKAHFQVFKHLRQGVISLEVIGDVYLRCTARRYLRALRLQKEICQLIECQRGQTKEATCGGAQMSFRSYL